MNKKSICIAFLGNAFNDTRVSNLISSFTQEGYNVKVISFDWTTPNFQTVRGDISVFKLAKSRISISFYLSFILKLWKNISKIKSDIYLAEDIYTLPVLTVWAKLRRARLLYNARELYPFLAGLRNKTLLQNIIKLIERFFIKIVDLILTTGKMDAEFIQQNYKLTNTIVVRNLPMLKEPTQKINLKQKLGIKENETLLLYQGVIFEGRGIDKVISALKELPCVHIVLLGRGVKLKEYENLARELEVSERVHFIGMVNQDELINYTVEADIGLVLIENISLSYYYALPNKLFEYICAGLPVLSSDLPQMKDIIETYKVGKAINIGSVKQLTDEIKQMVADKALLAKYSVNARKAALELNWDIEFNKVKSLLLG